MPPRPGVPPTPPVGVPVQRAFDDAQLLPVPMGDADGVPETWLTESEHLAAAERVDRLTADVDLVTTLGLARFTGPEWDVFATELARYGTAVIGGWLRRGLIFARCRDRGFGGLPEPPWGAFDDPDVVLELSNETVAKALHHFRCDVLMKKKWNARRGASLRTYFIGQCLSRFANIYRAWHTSERERGRHPLADPDDLDFFDRRPMPSVEELVTDQERGMRALRSVEDPRVRQAMVWIAQGLSQTEVAQRLRVSVKTVERMLAHERGRLRRRGA